MPAKMKANVLVVEDSLAVAKRLQISLEQAGYTVEVARNGRDAWEKAQRRRYEVVITDEQMPIMSGRELCQHLRADAHYKHTPIIFLTAAEFGKTQDDIDLRVSASFCKPFNPGSLVRAVETELTAARSRRKVEPVASGLRSANTSPVVTETPSGRR